MPRRRNGRLFKIAVAVSLALLSACGGGSSPTSNATPPTPPPTTQPPATQPPATTPPPPTGTTDCPLGKGTADTTCSKTSASFVGEVEAAIELLIKQKPELFDLNDQRGAGGYHVKDAQAYYDGVVRNLQAQGGLCAGFDFQYLNVKNSNDFSDQYDILLSDGHARRGPSIYQGTCRPASFPVDPSDVIAQIRVVFYGFKCDPGVVPPLRSDKKLPMGCLGLVTATPKDKDGQDVDPRIHGDAIVWKLEDGKGVVDTHHVDGQPFNWILQPLMPGTFSFCATLQGKKGCLNAEVVP